MNFLKKKFFILSIFLAALIASFGAYYLFFKGIVPAFVDQKMLFSGFGFVLTLVALVLVAMIIQLWRRFFKKVEGSKLHFRIVTLFGGVAIIPAVIMIAFSTLFFHYGVQSWFNDKVQNVLRESISVARSYLHENQQLMQRDALLLARDISNNLDILSFPPAELSSHFSLMADLRGMKEALIYNAQQQVVTRSSLTFAMGFEPIPPSAIREINASAPESKAILIDSGKDDRLRAIVRINSKKPMYLYVGRFVDSDVLNYLKKAELNVNDYKKLLDSRRQIELTFILIFIVVSLLVLIAALVFGLRFANRLIYPLEELSEASLKMAKGDLSVRVIENHKKDEINTLRRTFNNMATQLETQRADLLSVNKELSNRRHFVESILTNISSTVININQEGKILFANDPSKKIFQKNLSKFLGQKIEKAVPLFKGVFDQEQNVPSSIQRKILVDGIEHTLSIKILTEQDENGLANYFVTIEDVSDLMMVQKKAAWADVARQIAHEIKNPLTPIQLATERLRKKFIDQIDTGKTQFSDYIDTILRYVQQIQSLINAFSDFSRMPAPKFEKVDLMSLITKAVGLQKAAYPHIEFVIEEPAIKELTFSVDGNLIMQALTNVLKNAIESLTAQKKPKINIRVQQVQENCVIMIEDNGKGLPKNVDMEQLFDPYVTYSQGGTGLGLGIVRNILENHDGNVLLKPGKTRGVIVEIAIPLSRKV